MLLETLLILVALLAAAITLVAVVAPHRQRNQWAPTWDNLARLCSECEHELRLHADRSGRRADPDGCRGAATSGHPDRSTCGCRVTRQRAFPTSLTEFELQARKELRGLQPPGP